MYCFNNPRRLLVGEGDLSGVVEDLGEPGLFGVLVEDPAARAGVQGLQQAPVPGQVLHEGGAAVGRGVDVAVVAHGQHGLQGVAHHAGHRHRLQRLRLVVLEDVAPLAVQQEHHRLQPNSNATVRGDQAHGEPAREAGAYEMLKQPLTLVVCSHCLYNSK